MAIYTRAGDSGETSLANGSRCSKSHPRVEAYGAIDEANSALGHARAAAADAELDAILRFLQHRLLNCSSVLASQVTPAEDAPAISEDDVAFLERCVDTLMEAAGPMRHFIVPAGGELASRLHVARATLRSAERRVCVLSSAEQVDPLVLAFINRGSDVLFAAARYAAAADDRGDEQWDPNSPTPELD
jgi:cob(I)alamin adenosyltransferase